MIKEKLNNSEQESYINKISELRITLESLAKQLSTLEGQRDLSVQQKEQAELDKSKLLVQIETSQKQLSDLQSKIASDREAQSKELRVGIEKLSSLQGKISEAEITISGLKIEVDELTRIKNSLLPLKTTKDELESEITSKQQLIVTLDKEIKDKNKILIEKREQELKEAEELTKAREANEHVLAQIRAEKENSGDLEADDEE